MLINRSGRVLEDKPITDGMDLGERDLRELVFTGRTIEGLELSGSNLCKADFSGSDIYWLNCFHANCSDASFRDSVLEGANFKSACLRGVDFSRAKIKHDRLGRASSFAHADLTDANLLGALLSGAEYDQETIFPVDFHPKEEGMVLVKTEEGRLPKPWCGESRTLTVPTDHT